MDNTLDLKMIDQRIGQRLRYIRLSRGLSQERLADDLGISFQQLQKYESGKNRISGSRIVQICTLLNIAPSVLLDDCTDKSELDRAELSQPSLKAAMALEHIAQPALRKQIASLIDTLARFSV